MRGARARCKEGNTDGREMSTKGWRPMKKRE